MDICNIVYMYLYIYAIPTSSTQKLAVLIVHIEKSNMVFPLVIEYCLDQLVTNLPVHVYMCSYIINMYFEMLL